MNSTTSRFLVRTLGNRYIAQTRIRQQPSFRASHTAPVVSSEAGATVSAGARVSPDMADPDWMKVAIQQVLQHYGKNLKLAQQQGQNPTGNGSSENNRKAVAVSDEDLEKALQYFKFRLNEAQLCVTDCKECESSKDFPDEVAAAESALQLSVEGFLDLLELLRHSGTHQQERFTKIREDAVLAIRDIRSALNKFKGRQ